MFHIASFSPNLSKAGTIGTGYLIVYLGIYFFVDT